jgi:ATP-dependent Lhr-like helicase
MLARDLQRLQRRDESREVFDEVQVKSFLLRKQFGEVDSLDAYFDRFLEVGWGFDLWNHVVPFDYNEWIRRRVSGEILEGRFLNGRVRYVRAKDVSLFLSAFPRRPLSSFERTVLDVVRSSGGIDLYGIASKLGDAKERVKEALETLDYEVYVIRKFQGDGWTSRNLYIPFDPPKETVPNALEAIVLRFLAAYGPVTFSGIREWARFQWDELEPLLESLEERGTVARILVTGKSEGEMFVLTEDLPALRKASPDEARDRARVLSLLDPWTQPLWAQIASRYGEGWFYPIVKDGDLVGMAEIWEMSGCVEVRELDLASPDVLEDAIDALVRMMTFHRLRGVDVLRVTRLLGKAVPDVEDLSPWTRAGFMRIGDILAHGGIVPRDFDKATLLACVFHRQGIAPETQFSSAVEAAKALGGLRSDFAARLRVTDFRPLERLHRSGALAKGLAIPEYWTYCLEEDLRLYKAAKAVRPTKEMRHVLRIIQEDGPISRARLLALSDLSPRATSEALRKLYAASHVTRDPDNRYRIVSDARVSQAAARREVLRRLIRSVGVLSAESLAAYARYEYSMAEVRQTLREFEAEGWLAKGFLARGERVLYWILREDLDRLDTLRFERRFVLSPLDNLFLFLRSDVDAAFHLGSCYVVFDGPRMVAAFRARRRRAALVITEFLGDAAARRIVDAWERENEVDVGEDVERISDQEIMEWYAKMYGRGASDS